MDLMCPNFYAINTWDVARNNLVFSELSIFRVGDPVTLKMLNSFIVSLLRGAPNW